MNMELLNYLEQMLKEGDWYDGHTSEWARSIFTTICLTENIDVDTMTYDHLITRLYIRTGMKEIISFEEFENYMIKLIV